MGTPTYRPGLIDTDILVDASRGLAQAGQFLDTVQQETGIAISVISAMELMAGSRDSDALAEVRRLIGEVQAAPVTESVSVRACGLIEAYTLSHGMLIPDALIAATALEMGVALYTRNVRHFRMIPELLIITPY